MQPWVQPAYDALEQLLARPRKPERFEQKKQSARKHQHQRQHEPSSADVAPLNGKTARPYEALMQAGILEVEAIAHIRGR